jgi:hypothetical protein
MIGYNSDRVLIIYSDSGARMAKNLAYKLRHSDWILMRRAHKDAGGTAATTASARLSGKAAAGSDWTGLYMLNCLSIS